MDKVLDYVQEKGRLPRTAKLRFRNWGIDNGKKIQYSSGVISFFYKDNLMDCRFVRDTSEKKRFMNRKTKESAKLEGLKYFIWQPEFYEQS